MQRAKKKIFAMNMDQLLSIMDKLKFEIGSSNANDDLVNTRRLTVQSTLNEVQEESESSNVDLKITNLENLIKRLQDEIVELSAENISNTIIEEPDDFDVEMIISPIKVDEIEIMVDKSENSKCPETKSLQKSCSHESVADKAETDNSLANDELQLLINDLKAEINHKLETLKDVKVDMSQCNSDEESG